MRSTKIVATLGPVSNSVELIKELISAGMNVARLNFSHGSHADYIGYIRNIRAAAEETGTPVGILLDTQGPEIRTGTLKDGVVGLEQGNTFHLRLDPGEGDVTGVSISYPGLINDVTPGTTILIDDGLIGLTVQEITKREIICTITNGGQLGSRKGVNVPGINVNLPAVTDKDVADIVFGIEQDVDFIAASFIRRAADVLEIRKILEQRGADIQIIAKIESAQGVQNIDDILLVADGIMVARGDLGVEIPTEEVPLVQKSIIEKCNTLGKPVITATQMLDSMMRNPRPTRAEASDVANAIFDGSDAVMLSGETAGGKYPVEALKTMARIAQRSEQAALGWNEAAGKRLTYLQRSIPDAISHATSTIAWDLGAAAIITATKSGSTARMVSKYRPRAPIIAATPHLHSLRKLTLVWGVTPILIAENPGTDDLIAESVAKALGNGLIRSGDLVVISAGVPVGVPGSTNLIKVQIVGEVIARGIGIGTKPTSGIIKVVESGEVALSKIEPGDILVTTSTDREHVPAMEKAAGVITEAGGLTSHAAIVCLNLGIPVIVGVKDAMRLPEGQTVTLDTRRGLIYRGKANVI